MAIETEDDIRKLVESDVWMMEVLRAAESLNLPDWWIGAGFLRNRVWNAIESNDTYSDADVDLVYFDKSDVSPETDWKYDEKMKQEYPLADWEVRNQARMHYKNNVEPYTSTREGISNWVETATCIAVRLKNGQIEFMFCHGIEDLVNLVVRPTLLFQKTELLGVFNKRVEEKKWLEKWPNLKIVLK
jgi:hypothetical protein